MYNELFSFKKKAQGIVAIAMAIVTIVALGKEVRIIRLEHHKVGLTGEIDVEGHHLIFHQGIKHIHIIIRRGIGLVTQIRS